MIQAVDVVIIGAGSAGLSAVDEVKKVTSSFVMIDPGPLGTTCARTGCMPSKILIQAAEDVYRTRLSIENKLVQPMDVKVDSEALLKRLRAMRDKFVSGSVKSVQDLGSHFVNAAASFVEKDLIKADGKLFRFKFAIIATGSSPHLEEEWAKFPRAVLTSETLFDLRALPASITVLGAGPLGLELGQALSRLGVDVQMFSDSKAIGGLTDPDVQKEASRLMQLEFPLHTGDKAKVAFSEGKFSVSTKDAEFKSEALLASTGRSANTKRLGLEAIGIELDKKGVPKFERSKMKIEGTSIFIAGDVANDAPVLHEAAAEGRIAGYNTVHELTDFKRFVPMSICFTDPNIARVGKTFESLKDEKIVIGQAKFEDQGRSKIMSARGGLLRIYAEPTNGVILGAEMVAPAAEHMAHLLALAITNGHTVFQILESPIYHPTVEEGFRTALRDIVGQVDPKCSAAVLAICESQPTGLS